MSSGVLWQMERWIGQKRGTGWQHPKGNCGRGDAMPCIPLCVPISDSHRREMGSSWSGDVMHSTGVDGTHVHCKDGTQAGSGGVGRAWGRAAAPCSLGSSGAFLGKGRGLIHSSWGKGRSPLTHSSPVVSHDRRCRLTQEFWLPVLSEAAVLLHILSEKFKCFGGNKVPSSDSRRSEGCALFL